jgi:hypothetical protein
MLGTERFLWLMLHLWALMADDAVYIGHVVFLLRLLRLHVLLLLLEVVLLLLLLNLEEGVGESGSGLIEARRGLRNWNTRFVESILQ